MPPKVSYIADFHREIVTRLPLNIKRLVQGVGKFVGAVVISK